MRKLILLALLAPLLIQGQASLLNPFIFGTNYDYVLDDVSGGAAAYSTRLLSESYVGDAMEVRRSSDDSTTTVEFDSNNTVSATSVTGGGTTLGSWAGSDTLYIRTWYDQSGAGLDMIQTTAAAQPELQITCGTGSSKACIFFDSGDDFLKADSADVFSSHNTGNVFVVLVNGAVDTNYPFTSADEATATNFVALRYYNAVGQNFSNGIQTFNTAGNGVYGDSTVQDGEAHYTMVASNGSAWELRVDGSPQTENVIFGSNNGNWFNDVNNRDHIAIGGILDSTPQYFGGRYYEIIYFNPALSSGDVTTVEESQANYFGL